jgi:hypothetical protein
MAIERQGWRQAATVFGVGLALAASARAEDPASTQGVGTDRPRAVRQVGDRGAKVEVKRPGEAPPDAPPGLSRRMEKLRAVRAAGDPKAVAEPPAEARAEAARPGEASDDEELTAEERAQRRLERSKRARHLYWRTMTQHLQRPSQIPPDVRGELRHHARRLARLQRIQELAERKRDQKTLDRVGKLIAREHERHGRKMHAHFSALSAAKGAPAAVDGKPAAPAADDPKPKADDPDPEATALEDEEQGGEP